MKRLPFFTCILFFYSISVAQKTGNPGTDKEAVFDKYIQASIPQWKTTGLSVAVVKEGKVIFKKGYGVTDINTRQPFTTSTIAFCASTTKAMTAAYMAMLVDEGKVKWDDKLKNVLPGFRLYDPSVSDELTVKDLFTHNTGLGNGDLLWLFGYPPEEILRRMRYMQPAYAVRSSFIYQNLMYIVAGEVIKQVSGIPWSDFITQRIFRPLGMHHTYAAFKEAAAEPSRITPHFNIGDTVIRAIESIDNLAGAAGSVVSCIDDMTKWMIFLQDSTMINGRRLIKAETFAELFKPQAIVTSEEFYPSKAFTKPHWITYGLGWFQQDYRGKMVQFHTGSLDGGVAIFGMVPEEKLSFYFFGNLDHSELRHALMWKAIDLWSFNDNSRDWSSDLFKLYQNLKDTAKKKELEKEAKRVLNTKSSLPIEKYTGKYSNDIYGEAEIVLEANLLKLKFPNKINLTLNHWHYDVFKAAYNYFWYPDSWINFVLNDTGNVSRFEFDGIVYMKK